jgi:predicted nucleic acid-binding protein
VLDASVVVALALEEGEGAVARRLILEMVTAGARSCVPSFFDVECASALLRAARRARLSTAQAAERLLDILVLPLDRVCSATTVLDGLLIAQEHGLSAYDAVYVALSAETGLPLVTADARLVRALAGSPHDVILLDDVVL